VSPSWFLGVDVGGTFTDVVLGSSGSPLHLAKVLTTSEDPRAGVVSGIEEALAAAGVAAAEVSRVVHGTTLATNVILERRGGPVAFVTTEGFGDLLRLGREARVEEDRFDLWFQPPRPPVEHAFTFEVPERIDARGRVLVGLDRGAAEEVAARVAAAGPAAVAICLLNSYANDAHEELMAAACAAALPPETFVAASAHVWPEIREYERAMTTVMCAYVAPVMSSYLAGLERRLHELGFTCPIDIMESSGGVMSAAQAARRPVDTVESGGAAGVTAAGFIGRLLGCPAVISFDMGGTTAKTGIVRDGRPDVTHDFQVGGKGSFGGARPGTGFPLKVPAVDLAEVGAGGGSIGWVDAGGSLRVGPRSAGSRPGPACYGQGGDEPTVTDANFVLGYLNPTGLAGGVALSPERSRAAIERAIAAPLGLDVVAAARAVHEVANANMAAAIRVVTVQRGIDPRSFTLVAFGGAGPMHAVRLADTFQIRAVIIPRAAGVASAVGLVTADRRVDHVRTWPQEEADLQPGAVTTVFRELEERGRADLGHDHPEDLLFERSVDVRFRGQAHQLTVPVPGGDLTDGDLKTVVLGYHDRYRTTYGIEVAGPVQLVSFRVQAVRRVEKLRPEPQPAGPGGVAIASGTRAAHFPEAGGFAPTPVVDWATLRPGSSIPGPALVDGADTTVVIPPRWSAVVDGWANLRLAPVGASGPPAATLPIA
jgi:N-methylhydantoinase A